MKWKRAGGGGVRFIHTNAACSVCGVGWPWSGGGDFWLTGTGSRLGESDKALVGSDPPELELGAWRVEGRVAGMGNF